MRDKWPATYVWPPKFFIQARSDKVLNAFAGPEFDPLTRKLILDEKGKRYVQALITEGLMRKVVDGNADLLAFIMGHEISHLTLKHQDVMKHIDLEGLSVTRKQELDADLEGVKIAVAAGYPYKSGVRGAFRIWKAIPDRFSFEEIRGDHPPWADRLAFLDKQQPQIWKAMSAFRHGYFLLHAEQYRSAEACFKSIVDDAVKDGPQLAEVWANLGYARLMQYCDGLTEKDLSDYGIGQFVAGCFYEPPHRVGPHPRRRQDVAGGRRCARDRPEA